MVLTGNRRPSAKRCLSNMKDTLAIRPILDKIPLLLILASFTFLLACSGDQPEVFEPPKKPRELGKASLYLTTGDRSKLLSREPDLSRTESDNSHLPVIHINPDDTKQEIEGFGAALTGSSAYLI